MALLLTTEHWEIKLKLVSTLLNMMTGKTLIIEKHVKQIVKSMVNSYVHFCPIRMACWGRGKQSC